MSSAPATDEIARDARWLVQALDPAAGVVRLVGMDRDAYRNASFLDDRMLQQPVEARIVPWAEIEGALTADWRRDAGWIFHIGHVGSTLVARLLGELPGVLSIREPRFLRDLATIAEADRRPFADAAPAIYSRTFAATERALVKATSFVSEVAPELMPGNARALFMYARPAAYIASILAGEASMRELQILAASRQSRMAGRVTGLSDPRSAADHAAAAWACETTALEAAAEAMSDRHLAWLDFDRALGSMAEEIARAADFFGFEASSDEIERIARGPLIHRYSKAPEYAYSPRLRQDVIAEATERHRAEIAAALAKLDHAAKSSPALARALDRAQAEG